MIAGPKDYVNTPINIRPAATSTSMTVRLLRNHRRDRTCRAFAPGNNQNVLMGDDPSSVDLYSDVDDITFRKNLSFTVRWWTTPGSRFAGRSREQLRGLSAEKPSEEPRNGLRIIYSVTINMVPNHLDNVRTNISAWSARHHGNMALIVADSGNYAD